MTPRAYPRSTPFFRDTVQHLPDGVIVAGLDGQFLLVNPAAERIMGMGLLKVPPSQVPSAYGFFLPDTVTPCPSEQLPLARAVRGEVVTDFELFVRNQNVPAGLWLSVNSTPLYDSDGGLRGAVAVFRDVTTKKRERDEIKSLSNVVEETADSVVITDAKGRIEYVNPAFEATTGYTRAEVLGRSPNILKSGVHGPEFYRDMWNTLLEGRVFRETITNRKKNGELFLFEQTITPMKGPTGALVHLVSVAKDVTELRKAARRESELLMARSIQQKLYPACSPEVPGFDIAGAAFAADEIGGDYFDFVSLPGECLGLVIGDVSGHGIDSALLMAEARAVLRATAQAASDPGEILAAVNRVLAADMETSRFVTMFLGRLHGPTRTLTYASAGHTPGFVLDASGAVKKELTSTGVPLGPFPEALFPTRSDVVLERGEILVLSTDGVTESEGPDNAFFEADAALEVVRSCRNESASEIVQKLYRAARAIAQGVPQSDDMTIVICKAEAAP
jgi:sigma-B regulation protein RsbU (phosphoserine phosphatase)